MTQAGALRASSVAGPSGERIDGAREETSLLFFLSILLRNRSVIALWALIGLVVFGAAALTEANLYAASGSFAARPSRTPAQMPGLATQIGLSLGVVDVAQSTLFYAELARSNSILIPVAAKSYTVSTSKGVRTAPLATFMGIKAATPAGAAMLAAKELANEVAVMTSTKSGIVTVIVTDKDPQIAAQLTMNILGELDSYSSASRKDQAVAERRFVEGLVAESRQKLDDAEQRLASFRQQNRDFETAPQLKIRDDELVRDVDMAQLDYTGLESSYQQARIEEVRNLSAIRVVEYPDVPVVPQRREAARTTLVGLITGILVGIVIAFLRQRADEKKRAGDHSLDEYSAARRELSAGARRLLGSFSRSSAGP